MLKSADVADAVVWALGTPPNVQVINWGNFIFKLAMLNLVFVNFF